jgi:pilus assembly protein CpaC
VIPSFTVRRAETTLQLHDGQSFMIAGLVKNDVAESVNRIPGLGELPILGALFRSSEFQKDKTELMFVITPRLVKPLPPDYALPTDAFVEPSRVEYFLEGKMEGTPPPPPSKGSSAIQGGFEKK